ncbi:MAG: hypothetical protein KBS81_05310, partial [Spirochaetales bacterium]|nr:hypothetical protein [Candidatus Physcosoma equi]
MKKVLLVLLSVLMLVSCTFEPTHSPTQTENAGKGVVVLSDVPESGGEVTLVLYNEKQTQRITGTISGGNGSFTDIPADRYTSAELIVGSNHYTCGAFRVYDKKYRILGHSYYYGSEPGDYSTKLTFKSGVLTPVEPNAETVRIHFADLRSGIDEMTYG